MLPSEYLEQGGWTLSGAKAEKGQKVVSSSPTAVAWDLSGSILRAEHDKTIDQGIATILHEYIAAHVNDDINIWNDKQTKAQVLQVMRMAEREILNVDYKSTTV